MVSIKKESLTEENRVLIRQGLKRCADCLECLPLTDFAKCSSKRPNIGGVHVRCKFCWTRKSRAKRQGVSPGDVDMSDYRSRFERTREAEWLLTIGRKRCSLCSLVLPVDEFSLDAANSSGLKSRCKSCCNAARRASTYGLTIPQVLELLETCKSCEACGEPFTEDSKPFFDHCHASGDFRALLCGGCNTAIGFMGESVERAEGVVLYLKRIKA